jgi:hypothetical protein
MGDALEDQPKNVAVFPTLGSEISSCGIALLTTMLRPTPY